ncbi:DUF4337 domain-containing protein [Bdellovibrio svalbardensis]|uniref:DUF4337 domain-containing protein n=1 Tax=Bdellovibrio svalbardensis TaxID=2972972 RepID=A0ABT6DPM9_9BACT|nr:DUF4337 domain-containing protein [Bdellovibrio svalbardensis]MDG0818030.1 DUF4337 domain-containing protein [Bdellovibrio svalbardensis]
MTEQKNANFEIYCGVVIAVFAAIMAVSDLLAGKYGDDEIIGTNEKAAAYMWYQTKSIKETLVEGEKSLLESLKDAGALKSGTEKAIDSHLASLEKKIQRYKKEKTEILKGSQTVGPENWVQDINGQLGKIIGAQETEAHLASLSIAGDRFDMSSLFFQLCLVLGAMSLILKSSKLQLVFFSGMCVLGLLGAGISLWAYLGVA